LKLLKNFKFLKIVIITNAVINKRRQQSMLSYGFKGPQFETQHQVLKAASCKMVVKVTSSLSIMFQYPISVTTDKLLLTGEHERKADHFKPTSELVIKINGVPSTDAQQMYGHFLCR
jgi:hypothetical protein